MTDKELHSLMQSQLAELQPQFKEAHWQAMQRKLTELPAPVAQHRYLRPLLSGVAASVTLGLFIWLFQPGMPASTGHFTEVIKAPAVSNLPAIVAAPLELPPVLAPRVPTRILIEPPQVNQQLLSSLLSSATSIQVESYQPEFWAGKAHLFPAKALYNNEHTLAAATTNYQEIEVVYPAGSPPTNEQLQRLLATYLPADINALPKLTLVATQKAGFTGIVAFEEAVRALELPTEPLPLPASKLAIAAAKGTPDAEPQTEHLAALLRSQIATGNAPNEQSAFPLVSKPTVVVYDWTTAMHRHAVEAANWIRSNIDNPAILGYVFFTDTDIDGLPVARSGKAGAMYVTNTRDVEKLLEIMMRAARYGMANHDWEQNDLEAVLYAQEHFPEAEEIVLVADNKSSLRNLKLIKKINRPVHVFLCGTTFVRPSQPDYDFLPIKPDYLKLVNNTKGSMHVIENPRTNIAAPTEETLTINGKHYRFSRGDQRWEKIKTPIQSFK
jgi:hypothetical protein